MENRVTPKASGYAAPSGSSQTSTKIPRLKSPRSPRDGPKSSSLSHRPSKLPTPRSPKAKKSSSPELAQDKELKSASVSKVKESSIPKLSASKQHASPRHVITPRTLRTPSKLPQKHVRATEIKPGAYPRRQKPTTDEDTSAPCEQTHVNDDLTKFANELLESSSCDENSVQPTSEHHSAADFCDNDRSSISQCSSHEEYDNQQVPQDAEFNYVTEDKENIHPQIPPLPLHLLEDTDNAAETPHNSANVENINEGLEEEKGQLQHDMKSLKERLERIKEDALKPRENSGDDKLTQELEGHHT